MSDEKAVDDSDAEFARRIHDAVERINLATDEVNDLIREAHYPRRLHLRFRSVPDCSATYDGAPSLLGKLSVEVQRREVVHPARQPATPAGPDA